MKRQSIRVMLASEYPEIRSFLKRMVEAEDKTVIVGEAENGIRALTLARNLRPDVAIIDSYLPYIVGLDDIPLSRVGGLDTAQSISEDIPNVCVVLINSISDRVISDSNWRPDIDASLCRETREVCIPFTVDELDNRAESRFVFANVAAKTKAGNQKIKNLSDKAISFGGLSILGGLILSLTFFLMSVGVLLAAAGMVAMFFGLVGKLVTSLKGKAWGQDKKLNIIPNSSNRVTVDDN